MEFAFIDVETTGLKVSQPKQDGGMPRHTIVEVAAIKETAKGSVEYFERLCALDEWHLTNASKDAVNIVCFGDRLHDDTGDEARAILRERHKDAPQRDEVMRELLAFVQGCALVGHNLEQDALRFLDAPMHAAGLVWSWHSCFPVFCTRMMYRWRWPGLKDYSLEACCERMGIEPEKEHRAMTGAESCRRLWNAMWDRHESSGDAAKMGAWVLEQFPGMTKREVCQQVLTKAKEWKVSNGEAAE